MAGLVLGLTMLMAGTTAGCSDDAVRPQPAAASPSVRIPAYDPALPPSRAALAFVPADATTLAVTDFGRLGETYGEHPTGSSPEAVQRAFWGRVEREAPLLSLGVLREADATLRARFGFGRSDVEWEARFSGGGARGYVLRLRPGTPMTEVSAAVDAGVGPLAGARVDEQLRLVTRGAVEPGERNWAAEEHLAELLDPLPTATYVRRGCLEGDTGPTRLEALEAYAVDFGTSLATVRLGVDRSDLPDRLALAAALPEFGRVLTDGVIDPSGGRIGFRMSDPVAAAHLVLTDRLPVAVCAD